MGSLSIWHWTIVVLVFLSPILGLIRSVKNQAIIHAIASSFVPIYGLIYFFMAADKNNETS
jgi:hypothetical protein